MSSRKILQLCFFAAAVIVFRLIQSLDVGGYVHLSRGVGSAHLDGNEFEVNKSGRQSLNRTLSSSLPPFGRYRHSLAKPTGSGYSRILVVPRMMDDDVSWIAEELPDIDVAIYVANDPAASSHPPKNKGHEVMIYFTYIIDHYHELPDIVIFMHAHRFSHHNSDILGFDAVNMIKRLSNAHVARQGYVNMRCNWSPGCPEWLHPHNTQETLLKQEEQVLAESWSELFPHHELPRTLAQPCCAQFALSRDHILTISLSQYVFYRDWILRTPLSDYVSGRIWEYSWQFLFTGQSVHCPAERLCYCDGFGICFAGESKFHDFQALTVNKQNHEDMIKDLQNRGGSMPDMELSVSGRVPLLKEKIELLNQEISMRIDDAIKRGDDPRIRALECNRPWREGDGF